MSAAPPAPSNNNDGLSIEQYHRLADTTLETMLDAFEAMAEEDESVTDVEYSVCLSLSFALFFIYPHA